MKTSVENCWSHAKNENVWKLMRKGSDLTENTESTEKAW